MYPATNIGLLLLHALPLDGRMWDRQVQALPGSVVAPNLYDFGNNLEQWAAKSLKCMQQDRFVIVGCSVGGSCALEVMNLAPDGVAAAILIGTKARCDPDTVSHAEARRKIMVEGVEDAWEQYWKPHFASEDDANGVTQKAKQIAISQSSEALTGGIDSFYTRNSCEHIVAKSTIPMHIVTGDRDTLPGLSYARHLAQLSDNARLHLVANCGHYVPMMQPMALNNIISDAITEVC